MKNLLLSLAGLISLSAAMPALAEPASDWDSLVAPETARDELEALYKGLQSAHFDLYAHQPEEAYDARYQALREGFDEPISLYELALQFQKFTAFGHVAHARIDFPQAVYDSYRDAGGKTFPIYLRIVDGRAYVGEDYSGASDIQPGDEIRAIDGIDMAQWLARTAQHLSADTPYIAHSLLEFSFPKYLWVEHGERDVFQLTLYRDGEGRFQVEVPGVTRSDIETASQTMPERFALNPNAREAKMLNDSVAYLRPGPFYNVEDPENLWDASGFRTFIDDAFEQFLANEADTLIIDLRDNPGGDNSFSDLMIAWIADEPFRFAADFLIRSSDEAAASNQARLDANPDSVAGVSGRFAEFYAETPRGEVFSFDIDYTSPREGVRFSGDVYVLINRHSYSNAVNTAAIFQDYGWGVIAGEKTADMATTYGAMESFTLPETGLDVGFPKAHIIRPSGERKSDGVTPDLPIRTPIIASEKDDVLETLLGLIAER